MGDYYLAVGDKKKAAEAFSKALALKIIWIHEKNWKNLSRANRLYFINKDGENNLLVY